MTPSLGQSDATAAGRSDAPPTLRVLVVAPEPAWAQKITASLTDAGIPAALASVEGYLLALGYLARSQAPNLIVGPLHETLTPAAIRGLRKLARGAKLVLLVRPDQEPQAIQALPHGIDEYLIEPAAAADWLQFLPAPTSNVSPEKPQTPVPTLDLGHETLDKDSGHGTSDIGKRQSPIGNPLQSPDRQIAKSPDISSETPDPRPETRLEPLGDTDLVDQLLHHRQGVRDLGLRLLRQQSGLTDVAWSMRQEEIPPGRVSVEVRFDDAALGYLHAGAPTDAATLEPWAAWLSRWIALEQRMLSLWEMALRDELTGAWNRRYFQRFLTTILDRAQRERFRVTLMVFDIDDFKKYNDRFGHAAGDEILRETAKLMQSVVRPNDVVARIGGDEFAVIFWDAQGPRKPNSQHPADVRLAAERFQQAVREHRFPKLGQQAPGTLTISGGLAGFPWDGRTPEELLERADEMAMLAKRQGKNAVSFGPGAEGDHPMPDDAARDEQGYGKME